MKNYLCLWRKSEIHSHSQPCSPSLPLCTTDNNFLTRSLHYDIIESVRFSKGHEKPRDDPGSNWDAVEHTDKASNILLTNLTMVHLHQTSASTLQQRCDDASDTVLIENLSCIYTRAKAKVIFFL